MPKKPKQDYNPPDHPLTEQEADQYHLMYIRGHDREIVGEYLPENMHVDSRGQIRWRRGQAPNTKLNLKPENGFQHHPENQNTKGTSGPLSKAKMRTLRSHYKQLLNTTDTIYLKEIGINSKGKEITETKRYKAKIGQLIAIMQWHALKKLIKKEGSEALFSQIATEFRLNAGELPAQTIDLNKNESHYHEHDFTGLLDAADAILSRRRTLEKPAIKAENIENADFEVLGNGTDKATHKDLGQ